MHNMPRRRHGESLYFSRAGYSNCRFHRARSRQQIRQAGSAPNRLKSVRRVIYALLSFLAASTLLNAQQKSEPVHAVAYPPGKFVDVTPSSGINFQYQASHTTKKYLLETMGPGVALFDYDNDGRLDIFVVNCAPLSDPMANIGRAHV